MLEVVPKIAVLYGIAPRVDFCYMSRDKTAKDGILQVSSIYIEIWKTATLKIMERLLRLNFVKHLDELWRNGWADEMLIILMQNLQTLLIVVTY